MYEITELVNPNTFIKRKIVHDGVITENDTTITFTALDNGLYLINGHQHKQPIINIYNPRFYESI